MSGNIDRIQAQKDMRSLTIAAAAQGEGPAKQFRQLLVDEVGTIVKVRREHERDEQGFKELTALSDKLKRDLATAKQ